MARIKRPQPVATMDPWTVIRRPFVSEKSFAGIEKTNTYVMEVDMRATKVDVREAVEKIWNVRVVDVRTIHVMGKARRMGRKLGKSPDWKKAMVRLADGQGIDLMR